MTMFNQCFSKTVLMLFVIGCSSVSADEPSEQEALNAIARELELVRYLVDKRKPGTGRLYFDYRELSKELASLEYAVRAHLSYMNNQPRLRWDITRPSEGERVGIGGAEKP